MTTFSETTLPALIFSVPAGHPKGDVPALGRLTVNEAQAVDQWWTTWGYETNDDYAHTDSTGSGALFYEAESRTALGGSATAVGPSGASGGGSNVMRQTSLTTFYQAIISTQATGGGAHLSHVGAFRVFARVQVASGGGTVSLALSWSVGDFQRFTINDGVALDSNTNASWRLVDLGLVSIPKVLTGTQRWEGRILAKSTVLSADIDVDYIMLVPVAVGSGTASASQRLQAPATLSARDEFAQNFGGAPGALTGLTLPVGGTWGGAGDAGDFQVQASSPIARRTDISDADAQTGRYVTAGTPSLTNVHVQADFLATAGTTGLRQGVIARYTDVNNWLLAVLASDGTSPGTSSWTTLLQVIKRVAGTTTVIAQLPVSFTQLASQYYSIALVVDTTGRFFVWADGQGKLSGSPIIGGYDSVLATGGTLATGKVGIYDVNTTATASTRDYDNFFAFAPVPDAAMFASQSFEIRHDGAIREDSAGAVWQPVSVYEGDLLKPLPTSREQRSLRFIVKACRNDPAVAPDPAIDDINATLALTPRYLSVPAPT